MNGKLQELYEEKRYIKNLLTEAVARKEEQIETCLIKRYLKLSKTLEKENYLLCFIADNDVPFLSLNSSNSKIEKIYIKNDVIIFSENDVEPKILNIVTDFCNELKEKEANDG